VSDVGGLLLTHDAQIAELLARSQGLLLRNEQLQGNLTAAFDLIAEQQQALQQQGEELSALRDRLDLQDDVLAVHTDNLATVQDDITNARTVLEQQGAALTDTSAIVQQQGEQLRTVEDGISLLQGTLLIHTDTLTELAEGAEAARLVDAAHDAALATLRNDVNAMNGTQKQLSSALDTLRSEVRSTQETLTQQGDALSSVQTEVNLVRSEVSVQALVVEQLSEWSDALAERVGTLEVDSAASREVLAEFGRDVQALTALEGDSILVQSFLHERLRTDALVQQLTAMLSPQVVEATAGSSAATVRWALNHAVVTAHPGGQQCSTAGVGQAGATACVVPGLTNGQAYNFTVQIVSPAGVGPESAPSNIVVPRLECVPFSAATSGTGGGSVLILPDASVGCAGGTYSRDEELTLVAVPSDGFGFLGWMDPAGGGSLGSDTFLSTSIEQLEVRFGGGRTRVAAQYAPCHTLVLSVGSGAGNVSVTPSTPTPGCADGSYAAGVPLLLAATPADGYAFSGWSGSQTADWSTAVWEYRMLSSSATQVAAFARCLPLTLMSTSGGRVSRDLLNSNGCPPNTYEQGTLVTLTAQANSGFTFTGWAGTVVRADTLALSWAYTIGSTAASQQARFAQCFALTLTSSTGGTAALAPPQTFGCAAGAFISGANVSLTATAEASALYTFGAWAGTPALGASALLPAPSAAVASLRMPATALTLQASFARCYALSTHITPLNGGALTVTPARTGTCATGTHPTGTEVAVRAVPAQWHFLGAWGGALAGRTSTLLQQVLTTSAADSEVVAVFTPCFELTLLKAAGSAPTDSVSVTPPHSPNCPAGAYVAGELLTLTASTGSSSAARVWSSWAGAAASLTASNGTLSMPAGNETAAATFAQCYVLTLQAAGDGAGMTTAAPLRSSTCALSTPMCLCPLGSYIAGQVLSVSALPAAGSYLSAISSSGVASTPSSPLALGGMGAAARTATATYVRCYVLSVAAAANGAVTRSPLNSPRCAAGTYIAGALVNIEATSDSGFTFRAWTVEAGGAAILSSTSAAAATLTMPASDAAAVVASFEACYALSLTATNGALIPSPSSSGQCADSSYVRNAVVSLTAAPNTNYVLKAWGGALAGRTASALVQSLTIPATATSVFATFEFCYLLSVSALSNGAVTFSPLSSAGCPANRFTAAQAIEVKATPSSGYTFGAYSDTAAAHIEDTTEPTSTLQMPAAGRTLGASFLRCYALTLSFPGDGGGTTTLSPTRSGTCAAASFSAGESVTVTASASTGSYLESIIGAGAASTSPSTFTMPAAARTVNVDYTRCYSLQVKSAGNGLVTWTPANSPKCASGTYITGAAVDISAYGNNGFTFDTWARTGGGTLASATAADTRVTMSAAASVVTASFERCYVLTLTSGTGGDLAASPSKSGQCATNSYISGQVVSVSATPDTNYLFNSFGGALSGTTAPKSLIITAAATVTVAWIKCSKVTLSDAGSGDGTSSLSPTKSGICQTGYFKPGEEISVRAAASTNSYFVSMAGAVSSSTQPAEFTMTAGDKTVTVTFMQCYRLTVASQDTARGSVMRTPANSPKCPSGYYIAGAAISISADGASGWTFDTWVRTAGGGTLASAAADTSFTMPAATATVTANFERCFVISLNHGTGGDIRISPTKSGPQCATNTFIAGTVVTASAAAEANYVFGGFSGLVSGTGSKSWTVQAAGSITAAWKQCLLLTLKTSGSGSIDRSPASSTGCSSSRYISGTTVRLEADPAGGWYLVSWSGGLSGNGNPKNLKMDSAETVTARFDYVDPCDRPGAGGSACGGGGDSH